MENGLNVDSTKKGSRSYLRLNTLRVRIGFLAREFEKRFIYDSYANRTNKGTLAALKKFDEFKRKVSKNGKLIKHPYNNNSIQGYVLKADIKHFFDSVNQGTLLRIFERKIKDKKLLNLIDLVLKNFEADKNKNSIRVNKFNIKKQLDINQFITNPKLQKLKISIKECMAKEEIFLIIFFALKLLNPREN